MIRDTEELNLTSPPPGARHKPHRATVRATDWNFYVEQCQRFAAPIPTEEPTDWAVANVIFADTEVSGPFRIAGREYLRDIINDADDHETREKTFIAATGIGKTLGIMARHIWTIVHHPRRALMVMPATKGEGGSETYVTSRFIPALKATAATRDLMPDGQERLYMNSKKVRLNGCHFGFVGGNSPTQVASNRCSLIDIDEIDKMKGRLGNEAGTKQLVGERTEGVTDYQIFQSTTPTIEDGQGWKCLLRSDFRRRFLPCPRCNSEARHRALLASHSLSEANLKGWFDLAWSAQYCVLPDKFSLPEFQSSSLRIPRAFMAWDKEAKRKDDTYDRQRVVNSARFECPHCGGHIRDEDKLWMDKNGLWIPTRESHGHKGYHLSALYAPPLVTRDADPTHKSLLGGRALKFLDAIEEGEGMKNFINSTLAEVDVRQEHGSGKIEIHTNPLAQPDWVPMLTADFHKNWPYIWFVVRKWCAFKLLPPFEISNGKPDFVPLLDLPGNEDAKQTCLALVNGFDPAWITLAELMRFKSGEGRSPLVDFLLAQKITGKNLVKFYRETAQSNTMDFRQKIYEEMARHHGQTGPVRAPRGGDSELIAAGYLEMSDEALWAEMRDLEKEFEIGKGMTLGRRCVAIDCGYQEEFHREVLQQCYGRAQHFKWYDPMSKNSPPVFHGLWQTGEPAAPAKHNFCLPCPADGWLALRGVPTNRPLGDGKINHELGTRVEDPFYGTADAGTKMIEVLNVPQGLFWLRKNNRRLNRTKNTYTVSPDVSWFPKRYTPTGERTGESNFKQADYEKQLNEQYYNETTNKVEPRHGRGGSQNKRHPYHLDDCETYQDALATYHGFFATDASTQGTK